MLIEDTLTTDPVPAPNKPIFRKPNYLLLFLMLTLIIVVVILAYFVWRHKVQTKNQKQLPDVVKEEVGIQINQSSPSIFQNPTQKDLSALNEQTKDWQTYTNVKSKYLFKYPADLLVIGDGEHLNIVENDPSQKVQTGITFDVISQSTDVAKISDPIGTRNEMANGLIEEKISEMSLGGLVASVYLIEASSSTAKSTLVPKSQVKVKLSLTAKLLQISLYDLAHARDGKKIFNQILSTFKFL